jgi:hypothetical protein
MEFRYQKQYTEALSQLGRATQGWPLLERSLSEENAEQVSAALNAYVIAFLSREAAKQSFHRSTTKTEGPIEEVQSGWTNMLLLRKDYEFSIRQEDKAYRTLMIAMLGLEVVEREGLANVEAETESESEDDE